MPANNAPTLLISIAVATFLAACSSGPQIRADGDPSANLSSYKTFNFFDNLATDQSAYTTILTTRLKETTQRELERRGYQQVSADPQLLVNFNLNVSDRTDVQSTPAMGGYYGYRAGRYGMWAGYPQDVQTVHYQEGTLAIDLVDAAKQQLVWQGVAEGRIKKSAVENPAAAIDKVITAIFTKYPVPPAPSAPAAQ